MQMIIKMSNDVFLSQCKICPIDDTTKINLSTLLIIIVMIFTMNPDENYLKPGASEIGFSGVRVDEL